MIGQKMLVYGWSTESEISPQMVLDDWSTDGGRWYVDPQMVVDDT